MAGDSSAVGACLPAAHAEVNSARHTARAPRAIRRLAAGTALTSSPPEQHGVCGRHRAHRRCVRQPSERLRDRFGGPCLVMINSGETCADTLIPTG
jgi:hypothetical protein